MVKVILVVAAASVASLLVLVDAVPARALRLSKTYLRCTTYMSFSPLVTFKLSVALPESAPSKVLTGTSAVAEAARALGRRAVGGATRAEPVAHSNATATRRIVFFAGAPQRGAQQSSAVPCGSSGVSAALCTLFLR